MRQATQISSNKKLSGPVLVTGHTGFKGTWLTLLLEALDIEVIGLSLPADPNSLYQRLHRFGEIQEAFIDIRSRDGIEKFIQLAKPSLIFHLAAQPLVLDSYKSPIETFEVNVIGTANVLDASFQCGFVESIVVSTTDKVYRNTNNKTRFIESDPLAGKDPYSASKVGTENAILAWQSIQKIYGGPQVAAVRAGNVIGGGDWAKNRIVPDLVRAYTENTSLEIRNPQSTRPWQHVLDPLHGYVLTAIALKEGKEISSLNFGPSEPSLSVRDLVSIANHTWANKSEILYGEGENMVEAENLDLNSNLARETLNWEPLWTQEEAIVATFEWWKSVFLNQAKPLELCKKEIEFVLSQESSLF